MATQNAVGDQNRWAMAAIERRLAVAKAQLLQQQQQKKNDKDMKGASNVDVSSKETHQAESFLPTPSKTPLTKGFVDPKDDDSIAYTRLSHPVDENLMATNVKFSSAKGSIVDKVLHNLLRSGDSAQKYIQGTKNVRLDKDNYILLDNFVQSRSSASGSKNASQKNSKRSKIRMSMKKLKKSGALDFPKDLQKFDLFKPMHGIWESYMMQLIKVTGKVQLTTTLLSADLHGAFMFVAECKIASYIGVQGIMVRETSATFGIITKDDKFRVFVLWISVIASGFDRIQMEALSSLTFKGSVTEAIIEAKTQKKLFVVYISGEDEDSNKLNNLTWTDSLVAESLSKYCILLCIRAESVDATHFSAIYPYSSVPCIAAIGFSGTQAWKNEGFISAQDLASSLEKAWLGLHIQETMLSAALASQNSEQPASDVVLPSQGGSLDASPSTASIVQPSERKSTAASTSTKENNVGSGTAAVKRSESAEPSNSSDNAINQPASSVEVNKGNVEQGETSSHVQAEKEPIPPVAARPTNTSSVRSSSTDRKKKQGTAMNKVDSGSGVSGREINLAKSVGTKVTIKPKDEAKEEDVESRRKLSDVHLNIRLPDGSSLQEKFSVTSILRMVKDYVNSNQTVGLGAYDLAVPYPRKVYSDQDLDKSLSELGLFDRQALVVVLRKGATVYQRGPSHSESNNNTEPENVNNGGYFAYVRRVMSYANPLSYFGGGTANTSSSGPEPRSGSNPDLRNNVAQAGSSSRDPSESRSNVRNRRPTASRTGSNIHTLKHDEEDAPFGDGNAFWNGNSTQYGSGSGGDSNDRR